MWGKIFAALEGIVTDPGFDKAIEDAKCAKDLGMNLLEWGIPKLANAIIAKLSAPSQAVPATAAGKAMTGAAK